MEKIVWQHIVNGDEEAYKSLYFLYFKKFYNYGRKFTGDITLIEDCIQEVFLEIWSKRKKIDDINTPDSYFLSVFRYMLLKKMKQAVNQIELDQLDKEPNFFLNAEQPVHPDLKQKLQDALNNLTPRQREAIFLRFYEGLTYEEVASVLNISVKATYKIMARSLQALKKNLSVSFLTLFLLLRVVKL